MTRTTVTSLLLLTLMSSGVAMAYTPGVPVGLTGAPGEETCANCHDNLNIGPGWVNVSAPPGYSPGETIDVTVRVGHAGQEKWGFELTALDGFNDPVGQLTIIDPDRTQLDVDSGNGREYVMHTSLGTDTGVPDESPGWTFQWTAPAAARGSVTFYVCGVAANDAQGTNGDYVYTEALNLTETFIADGVSWGRIKGLFR